MLDNKIIATTTNSLDGWEIEEYLKPISSHIVAGTNLFSDMFAGISDIFGGRSESYQKQISSIHQEAIKLLKEKASEIGANCIVGMKFDHEQISGKGKSMFMVTATGTAAIAKTNKKVEPVNRNDSNNEKVDARYFRNKKKVKEVLNKIENKSSIKKEVEHESYIEYIEDDDWEIIINNRLTQAARYPILKLIGSRNKENKSITLAKRYFSILKNDDAKEILFKDLIEEGRAIGFIKGVIKENHLVDYDYIMKLLKSEGINKKKLALELLQYNKQEYKQADIEKLKTICNKIKELFENPPDIIKKDKMFSKKQKKLWKCPECGNTNKIALTYCSNCGRNKYGFKKDEINHNEAISMVNNKIEILADIFNERNNFT